MSDTHKPKQKRSKGLTPRNLHGSFEERKRAAYAKMGQLGGLARAKQMAEQGFQIKGKLDLLNESKDKNSISKSERKSET
jgi:hypothetical protein